MILQNKNTLQKIKITLIISIISMSNLFLLLFVKNLYKTWSFNNSIKKETSQVIKLPKIQNFKLWNSTISSLKNNKKSIELVYENYAIKLVTNELKNKNIINSTVCVKNTTTDQWKDKESIEIDLSQTEKIQIIEQIRIDAKELKNKYNRIDVYGINSITNENEYIETKELEENELTIIASEEYKKYILVYIPIEEIITTTDEIKMFKNDVYKLNISVYPDQATYKSIHIDEGDSDIIKINPDCSIEAVTSGIQEVELQAEEGKVTKKIKIIVEEIAEGIEIENSEISIIEGESKNIVAKVLPEKLENKKLLYSSENDQIATVSEEGIIKAIKTGKTKIKVKTEAEPVKERIINITVTKNKIEEGTMISVTTTNDNNQKKLIDSNYINGVLIVNKEYKLPSNYNPGINQEALEAFNKMKEAAQKNNIRLKIVSGYRSYKTQQAIYRRNVELYGEETANRFSAKPRRI